MEVLASLSALSKGHQILPGRSGERQERNQAVLLSGSRQRQGP